MSEKVYLVMKKYNLMISKLYMGTLILRNHQAENLSIQKACLKTKVVHIISINLIIKSY